MKQTRTTTVDEYLAGLPAERRAVLAVVRKVVKGSLPKGYVETVNWGMISYEIPLERYPGTYNGKPLVYAALGAQKSHCALYLMSVYGSRDEEAWLRAEFDRAGKKLDMGKSCIRFKKAEDLPLEAIGKVIARTTPASYIERYEAMRKK